MFAPLIGTIPFLGYLFRLEEGSDGAAFADTLKAAGDLRWKHLHPGDEMVVGQEGDVVFFLMCPYSMEETPGRRGRLRDLPRLAQWRRAGDFLRKALSPRENGVS